MKQNKIHKKIPKKLIKKDGGLIVTRKNVDEVLKRVKKGIENAGNDVPSSFEKIRVSKVATLVKKTIEKAEKKADERQKQKQNEYKLFSVWLSLPRQILGKTIEEYTEKMGLDDPMYLELLQIKNMTAFAKKYDVTPDTLTDWRRELAGMKNDNELHTFFDQFTKGLLLSFYREQLRRPTPQGVETWYEIIKDRKKNLNINLQGEVKSDLSDEAKAELKAIISKARRS